MDYTTLERVQFEANIQTADDDDRLEKLITAASRAIDRKITGESTNESDNYLLHETVTNQLLNGRLDSVGNIICYAHKPVVTDVTAMSYRFKPSENWIAIIPSLVVFNGMRIEAWTELDNYSAQRIFTRITYDGGLAEDDEIDELPADIVEAATILTIRFWREAQSGLADSIGVAELGQLIYTKAWPVRVLDILEPFMRRIPWRGVG